MSVIGKTATSVQAECCRSIMRRLACLAVLAAFLLPAGAAQAQGTAALKAGLRAAWRGAAPSSGAYVLNATKGTVLFQSRAATPRVLASNTKLFTASAILAKLVSHGIFSTDFESD